MPRPRYTGPPVPDWGWALLIALLAVLALLATVGAANAQPGLFVSKPGVPCTTADSRYATPVAGQTYCFDPTRNQLNVYQNATWFPVTLGGLNATMSGRGLYATSPCTNIASPVTGGSMCQDTTANTWNKWDGTGWQSDVALATKIVNVTDPRWNVKADGITNDSVALQAAIDSCGTVALGTVGYPNVSGGSSNVVGCIVQLPKGIILANVTLRPWVWYRGAGRWTTVLRTPNGAVGTAVMTGNATGWITITDMDIEGGTVAGAHGIALNRSGVTFGLKFILERLNFSGGYDQISLVGDTTESSIRDIYARSATNDCLRHTSGSFGLSHVDTFYCSAPGARGFSFEQAIGHSTFENLVAESTGTDAFYFKGCGRSTFTSLYAGDTYALTSAGYGYYLVQCSTSSFHNLFANGGASSQSAILLDGSYDNVIDGLYASGTYARYIAETANVVGTNANLMLKSNQLRRVTITGGAQLGFSTDTLTPPNLAYAAVQEVQNDPTAAVATNAIYRHEVLGDHITWRTAATASPTKNEGYGAPDPTERWSIYRDFAGGTPSYSLLGRNATNVLGVLPSTESLGTGLITGDSSTFTAGVGSWVGTANIGITSVPGGQSGNGGQVKILTGGTTDSVTLTLATLTTNTLYKLSFYAHQSVASGTKWLVRPWNNGDTAFLATSEYLPNQTGYTTNPFVLYFVADGVNTVIRISPASSVLNDTLLIDTITLVPVQSTGSLTLTGGRTTGGTSGPGQGGNFDLYGNNHATNPGQANITAFGTITILTTSNTSPALVLQSGGAAAIKIDEGGNGITGNAVSGLTLNSGLTFNWCAPTYGASIAIDNVSCNFFRITATDGLAFTVSNPTRASNGQCITIMIKNTSGGVLGAVTWGTAYKLGAAWTSPATGNNRSISFCRDNTADYEISRVSQDVPN